MKIRIGLIIAVLYMGLAVSPVSACEPAVWFAEKLAAQADMIVYGRVTDVSEDNRRATVAVHQFVGSEEAPSSIKLPATKDSRNFRDNCEDFSVKFRKNVDYIIFLKGRESAVELLSAEGLTALHVLNNEVDSSTNGHKVNVEAMMNDFSVAKNSPLQKPAPGSPAWGEPSMVPTAAFVIGTIIASVAIIWTFVRFYKK